MKVVFWIFALALLAALGAQIFKLNSQRLSLKEEFKELNLAAETLAEENKKLEMDIEYFSNFKNLAKEFKSLFNYREPSEKLIIIISEKDD